jgi:hypothetical protein
MKTKLSIGAIIFLAGIAAVIWGAVRLMSDPLGIGLLLGGAATIAAAIYVFKYSPKLP